MNKERKSIRLKNYDYSQPGYYYITICVHPDLPWNNIFGKINNGKMVLNEYGEIFSKQWLWIAERYKHILLDKWVIMPDHFHAIVNIVHPESNNFIVGTGRDLSLRCNNPGQKNNKPPTRKNKPLSQIIGAFKTTSSKMIHMIGNNNFTWQRSYYDHIIRDIDSLTRIRKYIINNPVNWKCNNTK